MFMKTNLFFPGIRKIAKNGVSSRLRQNIGIPFIVIINTECIAKVFK